MRFLKRSLCLILVAVCVAGAVLVQRSVDAQRDAFARGTYLGDTSAEPQIVLLTHLLGGFKGLLVDAVWLRAVKLQQQGKYWELYQLYDWMGKLEPRIEEIWEIASRHGIVLAPLFGPDGLWPTTPADPADSTPFLA